MRLRSHYRKALYRCRSKSKRESQSYVLFYTYLGCTRKTQVTDEQRVVDNGRIITAGGLTAGIDGALHVVKRLFGDELARGVANHAEYNWQAEGRFLPAKLAYKNLVPVLFSALLPLKADLLRSAGDTEKWDSDWRLNSSLTPAQTLARLNDAIETEVKWRRVETAAANASHWLWRDFKDTLWSGAISVTPRNGDPQDKLIRFQIFKAEASKARHLDAPTVTTAASAETLTGHLMPFNCRMNDPATHTTECALMPARKTSGYGLRLSDGTFVKFDQAGDEQAVAALKATTKKNDLKAQATGARAAAIPCR